MAENQENNVLDTISLNDFKFQRILFNNAARKSIGMLGSFFPKHPESASAIVIVEKVDFTEDNFVPENADNSILKHICMSVTEINNIYGKFAGIISRDPEEKFGKLSIQIIYPATENHIKKYEAQKYFMIEETPEMYTKVTLPYLEQQQFNLDWVYNILEHKKEADKILYEDSDPETGFIILPDYKWNGQIETMYIQAIVMNRTIKSIRELNSSHLPLLEKIKAKGFETVKTKYGLETEQIRAYFHYQPSFYHLHVHFTYLQYDAPGTYCGKAHLLSTVIDNIKLIPDYYQRTTLSFYIGELHGLYRAIKESQNEEPAKDVEKPAGEH